MDLAQGGAWDNSFELGMRNDCPERTVIYNNFVLCMYANFTYNNL